MSAGGIASIAGAAALVLLAAGLAAIETAIVHVSRASVAELLREQRRGAERLRKVLHDAPRQLNALLLVRTLAEMVAVTLVAVLSDEHLSAGWEAILLAAGVMTLVNFVVIGVCAKTIGRQHPVAVALPAAGVAIAITKLLGPIPAGFIALGNAVTPGRGGRDSQLTSEAELRDLVDLASERQVIETGEGRMIQSVFELSDTIVREVMVPRTDMVWIERTKTVRQALSLALRSGFSRIPVIGDNEDDVVGVAYLKDLARRVQDDNASPAKSRDRVDDCMRPAHLVPDSKPVDELLREMQGSQVHLSIVIDEYGGTAGLVTIEDILEEIVGEIADEYDREGPRIEPLDDGSVRVNIRVPVDDIEELFDVTFDIDDVDTVGGLLASALGRVPIPGATIKLDDLTLTAESAKGRRHQVGTVLISRTAQE